MSSPIPIFITEQLKETLRINKIDPDSYGPAYGGESACLDLYYTPPHYDSIAADRIVIEKSRFNTLIPTGLHIALPRDRVALILERSSITKTAFKVRAGVIDSGYTGEIFINCVELNGWDEILPFQKLPFQLLITTCFNQFQQLSPEEWEAYIKSSARLNGCVGSSDSKI